MSSTNKTPNYALPQFIPTDKPTWLGDVNAAMLAIDTAMADNHTTAESANTSASAAVAQVQHAVDTANEAKVDSAAALQNATNAIGVAQNALNSATQATQTAQAATQTANAANNSAASALATANQAKQTAEATDAELTEFHHAFTKSVNSITQPSTGLAYASVNPALISLIYEGSREFTTTPTLIWEFNGPIFGVGSDWVVNIWDNLTMIVHPVVSGTQKIELATKNGSIITNNQIAIVMHSSTARYETFIRNNPQATRINNDACRFLVARVV